MALIGELSDLSLGELIEFFCNQRKTGRLKVVYPVGPGFFYLKAGSVVHAQFGDLRGIDAVYFALTQPNASFTFNAAFEPPEQTINQPWTSVVLEGLRRMDQGVPAPTPTTMELASDAENEAIAEMVPVDQPEKVIRANISAPSASKEHDVQAYSVLSQPDHSAKFQSRRWSTPAIIGAVALLIVIVGVPWGFYARSKARQTVNVPQQQVADNPPVVPATSEAEASASPLIEENTNNSSAPADPHAAKRLAEARAKERARMLEQTANQTSNSQPATQAPKTNPQKGNSKSVTVTVTYDENGRVTGASGGDATALRIARQKRFPAGKPGSATVTIPIN